MRTQNLSQRLVSLLYYWQLECLFFFFFINWKTLWVSVAENNLFHSFHKNILNKGRLKKGLRNVFFRQIHLLKEYDKVIFPDLP